MFEGAVHRLFVTGAAGGAMRPVDEVKAVVGKGLDGDRYAAGVGHYSGDGRPGRQLTLIELEAVAAVTAETGIALEPGETRRNVVTQGVPLNHLVGRRFAIGAVVLEGVRLCEPCVRLEALTRDGVRSALVHRGGLRAEIVDGGVLRVGDPVRPC